MLTSSPSSACLSSNSLTVNIPSSLSAFSPFIANFHSNLKLASDVFIMMQKRLAENISFILTSNIWAGEHLMQLDGICIILTPSHIRSNTHSTKLRNSSLI